MVFHIKNHVDESIGFFFFFWFLCKKPFKFFLKKKKKKNWFRSFSFQKLLSKMFSKLQLHWQTRASKEVSLCGFPVSLLFHYCIIHHEMMRSYQLLMWLQWVVRFNIYPKTVLPFPLNYNNWYLISCTNLRHITPKLVEYSIYIAFHTNTKG